MYYRKRKFRGRSRRWRIKRARFKPPNQFVGQGVSKTYVQANDDAAPELFATKVLKQLSLADIPHTTTNEINKRQRAIVNLRGIKICMEVANLDDTSDLYFNLAMVVPKDSASSVSSTGFFRGMDDERDLDFGIARTALELHCSPINSDYHYVLMHKRYRLAPTEGGVSNTNNRQNSMMLIQRYVKFNRQIRYPTTTNNVPCQGHPFLVYWCDLANDTSGSSSAPANKCSVVKKIITYFREPKN